VPASLPTVQNRAKLDSVIYVDAFDDHDTMRVASFKHHLINHFKAFMSVRGRTPMAARTSGTGSCRGRRLINLAN